MSKYDNTKFYWLQLKEDFFDDDAIEWLEEQKNGKEYSLFYLKLCLKSLKTNGVLIRKVGDMLVPYDAKKLAEITKTNIDTVVIAMKLLEQIGLIKILEGGAIYIQQLENMIGSQSIGAFKKQQQRRIGRTNVAQVSANCPIEKELEVEKEKDSNNSSNKINIAEFLENEYGRTISPIEYEEIAKWREWYSDDIILYAIKISILNNKKTFSYINGILKNWKSCNYKTLEEIKKENYKNEDTSEKIIIEEYDWLNDEE